MLVSGIPVRGLQDWEQATLIPIKDRVKKFKPCLLLSLIAVTE
jgi:hypothetical protein